MFSDISEQIICYPNYRIQHALMTVVMTFLLLFNSWTTLSGYPYILKGENPKINTGSNISSVHVHALFRLGNSKAAAHVAVGLQCWFTVKPIKNKGEQNGNKDERQRVNVERCNIYVMV